MKKPMVPLALGLAAVAVTPLPSQAVDPSSDRFPIDASQEMSQFVQPESSEVTEMATQHSETAQVEMPVGFASASPSAEPSGALSFEPPPYSVASANVSPRRTYQSAPPNPPQPMRQAERKIAIAPPKSTHPSDTSGDQETFFEGGSESLVARTVGAAEGTRTVDGGKTNNYYGHVDPGNGVWNRGTFSYQFGNKENLSPDEADRRQLAKIKRLYESVLLPKAEQRGVAPLTIAEEINGIDLINQAPLAVTEEGGYIEQLANAKKKGLSDDAAILEARVQAFWSPEKGGWDAPGLRAYDDISKEESIRRDQERRMSMISQALDFYEQQNGQMAQAIPKATKTHKNLEAPSELDQVVASVPARELPKKANSNTIADAIIFNGL